jgi:translation initiation factor 2B subunit (eIF-2B alpha/beta/delta family)
MPVMGAARDAGWSGVRGAAMDRASGAAEIALRAAEALAALPPSDLLEAIRTLLAGHRSMAPLWRLGSEALQAADHRAASASFARRILAERQGIAEAALPHLRSPVLVLHSYSSTLVAAVALSRARALCARSDPGGEGALTAMRLRERGLSAEVLDDEDAVAAAVAGSPVVTGADAVGPGGVVNKVGTGALAAAARSGGGGCYALAGTSKLLARDVPAPHPFERTELGSFASILTEDGPLGPTEAAAAASRFPLHPALEEALGQG